MSVLRNTYLAGRYCGYIYGFIFLEESYVSPFLFSFSFLFEVGRGVKKKKKKRPQSPTLKCCVVGGDMLAAASIYWLVFAAGML